MTAGKRATEFRACGVWGEMTDRGFEEILAIHGVTALSDDVNSGSGRKALTAGEASTMQGRSLAGKLFYGSRYSPGASAAGRYGGTAKWILGLWAFEPTEWTKILRLIGDCIVAAPIERNGRNRLPC